MGRSRITTACVKRYVLGLSLTLASALLTSRVSAQSVILDLASDPLGTVEIHTISGPSVVELSRQGTWTPAPPTLTTPGRIAIPPGTVVTLHGRDGVVLHVSTDSQATRNLALSGNTIRLQNTLIGGKPRLVVLETDLGVLGPPRKRAGEETPAVP